MPHEVTTNAVTTTYAYGLHDQRVKKTTAGTDTRFFDRYLEHNNAGLTRHYWAGDQLIATRAPTGSVTYLLQDRQHSTRVATTDTGNVVARYNYQPYGKQEPVRQADATTIRWQGQHTDTDNGLVHMNARYYDPELGQFTAPDSIIPDPYRPQSLNRYSFVEWDPINYWDPTGHMRMRIEQKQLDAERARQWRGVLVDSTFCGNGIWICLRAC